MRSDRSNGHIVRADRCKCPVVTGTARIKEAIAVQVVTPRRFALVIQPDKQRKAFGKLLQIFGTAADHRAKFALPDQALTKVRIQRQIVCTEKARELQLLAVKLPDIVQRQQSRVRLISLPRVDGISKVGKTGVVRVPTKNRNQSGNIGPAIVSDACECEPVRAEAEALLGIDFVLLSMLEAVEKSISVRSFNGQPGLRPSAESSRQIDVALITSEVTNGSRCERNP